MHLQYFPPRYFGFENEWSAPFSVEWFFSILSSILRTKFCYYCLGQRQMTNYEQCDSPNCRKSENKSETVLLTMIWFCAIFITNYFLRLMLCRRTHLLSLFYFRLSFWWRKNEYDSYVIRSHAVTAKTVDLPILIAFVPYLTHLVQTTCSYCNVFMYTHWLSVFYNTAQAYISDTIGRCRIKTTLLPLSLSLTISPCAIYSTDRTICLLFYAEHCPIQRNRKHVPIGWILFGQVYEKKIWFAFVRCVFVVVWECLNLVVKCRKTPTKNNRRLTKWILKTIAVSKNLEHFIEYLFILRRFSTFFHQKTCNIWIRNCI